MSMTKDQNLEIIRQACIKENPSIMELGFGCEVKLDKKYTRKIFQVFCEDDEDVDRISHLLTESSSMGMVERNAVESVEILGRPIRLADVLLAIGSTSVLKINNLGGFSWFIDNEWKNIATPRWNLLKDTLQDQSESTLLFLAEILK